MKSTPGLQPDASLAKSPQLSHLLLWVQLMPDRVRLDVVGKQHGAMDGHLAGGANKTGVSQGAINLELFKLLKHTKL